MYTNVQKLPLAASVTFFILKLYLTLWPLLQASEMPHHSPLPNTADAAVDRRQDPCQQMVSLACDGSLFCETCKPKNLISGRPKQIQ